MRKMFCCFGGKTLDKAFAKLDAQAVHKATVIGDDHACMKRFFQHVRFLNEPTLHEEPLDAQERLKVSFYIRRQKINDLLLKCTKLKVEEHEDMKPHLERVEQLAIDLEGRGTNMNAIFRSEGNQKILEEKDAILALATFLEASSNFDYEKLEATFDDGYKFSVREMLSVVEDGQVGDWAPTQSRIGNVNFSFSDHLSKDRRSSADFSGVEHMEHDLVILIIPAVEVLKDSFEEYMDRYRVYMSPCVVEDGPTMVLVLTGLTEMKDYCRKKLRADYVGKIEDSTKRIVEFCCTVVEDQDVALTKLKLPLVTFVDFDDFVRFRRMMNDIAKVFSGGETDQKRTSVFLNERESFFT